MTGRPRHVRAAVLIGQTGCSFCRAPDRSLAPTGSLRTLVAVLSAPSPDQPASPKLCLTLPRRPNPCGCRRGVRPLPSGSLRGVGCECGQRCGVKSSRADPDIASRCWLRRSTLRSALSSLLMARSGVAPFRLASAAAALAMFVVAASAFALCSWTGPGDEPLSTLYGRGRQPVGFGVGGPWDSRRCESLLRLDPRALRPVRLE